MKTPSPHLLRLATSGATILGSLGASQAATLLEFTNQGPNGGDPAIDPTYGDNVTASDASNGIVASIGVAGYLGTPNITLDYASTPSGQFDSYPDWDFVGNDVLQTDYQAGIMSLNFIPGAGFGVLITAFDLDEFTGGGDSTVDWSITNGATTIVSGTWDDFNDASGGNGGSSTVDTGMTEAQAIANAGNTLSLNLTLVAGSGSYQALDNLAFDQVDAIPEAGTAVLCLAGLGAGAMRRRRK